MAHLNHRGPDEKGPKTGRKLGLCNKSGNETINYKLGQGMGRGRFSLCSKPGRGLRLNSYSLK